MPGKGRGVPQNQCSIPSEAAKEEAVEKEKRVAVLEAARVAVDLVVLEELEDAAIVVG